MDEVAGPVPVAFSDDPEGDTLACFSAPLLPAVYKTKLTQADMARLLQLAPDQIKSKPYIAGCGALFQFVELTGVDAVSQASADLSLWSVLLGDEEVKDLCIYSINTSTNNSINDKGADIRMRMFAPLAGIPEDPATGSAAAALVGGLAISRQQSGNQRWMIEQGREMGRPSLIGTCVKTNGAKTNNHAKTDTETVTSVEVFGSAVLMSKGSFYLYDA